MCQMSDNNVGFRVVFATTAVVHHTVNLAEAFLSNRSVKEFVLIIFEEMTEQYRKLGNDDSFDPQRIKVVDVRYEREKAKKIIDSFDVVIALYDLKNLLKDRIRSGKPIFIFSERIFKKYKDSQMKNRVINMLRFLKYKGFLSIGGYYRDNVYFLTAGKHSAMDYKKLGVKEDHIIPFGYFPQGVVERREVKTDQNVTHLLWVGRLVGWKHPEYSIKTYDYLKKGGYNVDLTIVGNGERESLLKSMISSDDRVYMPGGLPTKDVRKKMRECDILLFTSNEGEGWGMVLNEGMAEGLVPVASYSAGSTTELVKDGVNGFVYYNDDVYELYSKTEMLVKDKALMQKMRERCYETIETEWNADEAVKYVISKYIGIVRE